MLPRKRHHASSVKFNRAPATIVLGDATRLLMKEAFLLEMERKLQMGEAMLSTKVVPLAIHRQD